MPAMTLPADTTTGPVCIATHNGTFHADDVFGVAVLMLLHPHAELVRTRDARRIAEADFAVDVGGEWDVARGRFDHHQRGFSGARPNGVVYASAGLVWAAFGVTLVRRLFGLAGADPALAQAVGTLDALIFMYTSSLENHFWEQECGIPRLNSWLSFDKRLILTQKL